VLSNLELVTAFIIVQSAASAIFASITNKVPWRFDARLHFRRFMPSEVPVTTKSVDGFGTDFVKLSSSTFKPSSSTIFVARSAIDLNLLLSNPTVLLRFFRSTRTNSVCAIASSFFCCLVLRVRG